MIQRVSDIETVVEDDVLAGLRMTADEFLQILDESKNYELINGIVTMTPSPAPKHQHVAVEILYQIRHYLESHPIGTVLMETDVHLGADPTGGDFVYRPEVVYYGGERADDMEDKLVGPPDLVVEVVSRGSRRYDSETKKVDYERYGVREYWLIDPKNESFMVYRLERGKFVERQVTGETYATDLIQGFVLDVTRVRRKFRRR